MNPKEEAAIHKARYDALRSVVNGVRADLIIGTRNPFRRRAVMAAAAKRLYAALYTYLPPEEYAS